MGLQTCLRQEGENNNSRPEEHTSTIHHAENFSRPEKKNPVKTMEKGSTPRRTVVTTTDERNRNCDLHSGLSDPRFRQARRLRIRSASPPPDFPDFPQPLHYSASPARPSVAGSAACWKRSTWRPGRGEAVGSCWT